MRRFVLAVAVLLGTTAVGWAGDWRNGGARVMYHSSSYKFKVDIYAYVGTASSYVDSLPFTGPTGGYYPEWTIGASIVTATGATSVTGEIMRAPIGTDNWVDHNPEDDDMVWTYVP